MTRFDFNRRFKELTGHTPFGWQRRLFGKYFMSGCLPSALDLPTGLGKASVMAIWYLAGARVPRRGRSGDDGRRQDQETIARRSITDQHVARTVCR